MESAISLDDVRRAFAARDPALADLIAAAARGGDARPTGPVRDGALTWWDLVRELRSRGFAKKPAAEQAAWRRERLAALEAPDAEVPLPDRWRLHATILELWTDDGPFARSQLLRLIATVPLRYGPWRALKQIFKEAEARQDFEVYGALAARLDNEFAQHRVTGDVSRKTLGYLVRRAWRTLRRLAETLPAAYADAAVEVLCRYTDDTNWSRTWIANHLFYHGTGEYGRRRFRFRKRPSTLLKYRAASDLWRRTPRPLFALLERAQADQARRFAIDALKTDFRATLREVEPSWVARLIGVRSPVVDVFVVWLLDNVPRFERGALRGLGLHQAVLSLLDSSAEQARASAAAYARTHARDLPLAELLRLADHADDAVRGMAHDLLGDRDPRDEVGLDGWGRLLGTDHAHDLAAKALRKHFTARELTPAWFRDRLLSSNRAVVDFAAELLPKVHNDKQLGAAFYRDLLDAADIGRRAVEFALNALQRFPAAELEIEFVRRALLHPHAGRRMRTFVNEGRVKAVDLGAGYLKALADEGTFAEDAWIAALRKSGRPWARDLEFDHDLAGFALDLLRDVRLFSPDELGFDWLMKLAQRTDERAHDFAVEYMTKAFIPSDFAPKEDSAGDEAAAASGGEINIDLQGASFLFTGALATMTRSEATKKVSAANGSNASGVNKNLDYLVIGDEGSPLYGAGRKGSKQVKAESLIGAGAGIKIISETAFLQMLAGKTRKVDDNAVERGCERLWGMLTGPDAPDAPLARFALHYIRRHHVDICPAETDRYVDPGAEVPESFLSFERVRGLLADARDGLREFGIELATWSLAKWAPPMAELVTLFEQPYENTRSFIAEALTAEEAPHTARFRIDPAALTADAVYRFCESLDEDTRGLGMRLIAAHPRLALPEELFRLTESPDRRVRAFVVAQLWRLYRDRGVTGHWKPSAPPETKLGRGRPARDVGEGAPARPASPPAAADDLRGFLRLTLFGIPPARLPRKRQRGERTLRPLPARKAKLALIDVVRDLAVADAGFAAHALPLFDEFSRSRGESERAACLVAATRIRKAHPGLGAGEEAA